MRPPGGGGCYAGDEEQEEESGAAPECQPPEPRPCAGCLHAHDRRAWFVGFVLKIGYPAGLGVQLESRSVARFLPRKTPRRRCIGTRKADPTRQPPGACTQASATAGSAPARHDSGPRGVADGAESAPEARPAAGWSPRAPSGCRHGIPRSLTLELLAPGAPLGVPARPHELSVDVCSHSTVGVLRALARFSPCRRPPPPSDRRRTRTLDGMTAAHSAVRLSSALARPTFFLLCGLARARSSTRATSRRPCRSFCAGLELPSLMGARPARHSRTPWSAAPRALTPPTFAACALSRQPTHRAPHGCAASAPPRPVRHPTSRLSPTSTRTYTLSLCHE